MDRFYDFKITPSKFEEIRKRGFRQNRRALITGISIGFFIEYLIVKKGICKAYQTTTPFSSRSSEDAVLLTRLRETQRQIDAEEKGEVAIKGLKIYSFFYWKELFDFFNRLWV